MNALELLTERGMPAAIDAERSVLGGVLLDNTAISEASNLLRPEDFTLEAHRKLFSRMMELIAEGTAIDMVTLTDRLGTRKEIESIGGVAYISSLTDGLPHRPSIASYCKIVRDKARRRQFIKACEAGIMSAADTAETTPECLSIVEDRLLELRGNDSGTTLHSIADVMPEVIQQLRDEADGRIVSGLSYGLADLDVTAGLMRPGELVVAGALPGRGKTALAAQIISANAVNTVGTMDFSIEMSRWQLGKRLLAGNSSVPAARIREPRSIREQWPKLLEAAGEMKQWPVWFDDSSTITLHELTSRARLAIKKHKVRLIIVDYLRLVRAKGRDLRERVGNVADGLRQLAKSENVTVVLLSQLSRPGDINERPTMLSLKESGDIEAHAHVVILIYTPEDEQGHPTGEDEIIVGKCREGTRGPVFVYLHKERLQFVPREMIRRE